MPVHRFGGASWWDPVEVVHETGDSDLWQMVVHGEVLSCWISGWRCPLVWVWWRLSFYGKAWGKH